MSLLLQLDVFCLRCSLHPPAQDSRDSPESSEEAAANRAEDVNLQEASFVAGGRCSCLLCLSLFFLFVEFFDGLYLLLQLHPPVLEPDFDLPLREAECMCHLDASSPRQIMICVEFLLQLQRLVSSVRLPAPSPQSICTWGEEENKRKLISARDDIFIRYFILDQAAMLND